jgi:hypothetical protein
MMNDDKEDGDNNTRKMTIQIKWGDSKLSKIFFVKHLNRSEKCVCLMVGNPDESSEITRPQIRL